MSEDNEFRISLPVHSLIEFLRDQVGSLCLQLHRLSAGRLTKLFTMSKKQRAHTTTANRRVNEQIIQYPVTRHGTGREGWV